MSKKQMSMCYPYGMGVSCICDAMGRIYKCFPNLEGAAGDPDLDHEALLSRDDRGNDGSSSLEEYLGLDGLTGSSDRRRGLDERTEIILAATFLVLIILSFISFVIYRCEKNYMRRRLQETFHISPSGGTLSTNGGMHGGVPSISVSVQTEPLMHMAANGTLHSALHGGQTILANGHHSSSTQQTGGGGGGILSYATLPHNAHLNHHHNQMVSGTVTSNADDVSGVVDRSGTNGGSNGNGGTSLWSRDMSNAQSYRDVRDGIMSLATGVGHSRDNTLSRDAHIHLSRDDVLGLRASCTQDNLRSPSVLGHHSNPRHSVPSAAALVPNDDDDANTEYAESDVMLGGGGGSSSGAGSAGSNGSSGNARADRLDRF